MYYLQREWKHKVENDVRLASSITALKNLSDMYELSEYHKLLPLGGSAIFHADRWTTTAVEIIAPLIAGLQKKFNLIAPPSGKKKLIKIVKKNKRQK